MNFFFHIIILNFWFIRKYWHYVNWNTWKHVNITWKDNIEKKQSSMTKVKKIHEPRRMKTTIFYFYFDPCFCNCLFGNNLKFNFTKSSFNLMLEYFMNIEYAITCKYKQIPTYKTISTYFGMKKLKRNKVKWPSEKKIKDLGRKK